MSETRTYGLLKQDLEAIISILKKNPKIDQVILFGSRAKGNNRKGSDIDLAIKGENLVLDDILEAKIRIDKLSLPYKFDIVIYERIKDHKLIDHVNRMGVSLFQK